MDAADIVNRIVEKLGGNRVEFLVIDSFVYMGQDVAEVSFVHGDNTYLARSLDDHSGITVRQEFKDQGPVLTNQYTEWLEGVLNGLVRNDAGVLVKP